MTEEVNETLLKMVKNLKSSVQVELNNFEFNKTPLKRPLSTTSSNEEVSQSSSFEEHTPVSKKLKKMQDYHKLDVTYVGSPREMRRIRSDLVESRNTILNLESRISHMHNVQKEMRLMFENETKSLKRQHEYDRKNIDELESQLQNLRQREIDLKQKLAEATYDYNILKAKKDEEVDELEKSICELKEESRVFDGEESSEIIGLNRKLSELQMRLDDAEDNIEAQRRLIEDLESKISEKNAVERDVEMKDQALQTAKLRIKELEYAKENFLEFQEQAKTQVYKLSNYVDMERENERLKEENIRLKDEVRNKLILEEEVHSLKSRLSLEKEQEKRLTNLQIQQVQTEMYLDEWRTVARGICETTGSDSSLPHLLRSAVERLQQQEINLTSAKVELESQLKVAVYEAKVAKTELEKCTKHLADMKRTGDQKQTLIHRMQKKLLLLSRERDSYRQQLDSYEKDLTMTINPSSAGGAAATQLQNQRERISNLEKIVDSYRELNAKLEGDLQNCTPGVNSESTAATLERISGLQDEVEQLRNDNERLQQRKDHLEIQLEAFLVGNDTLQGGQVYHLATNPLAECLAQREQLVDKLQQEIMALKRKVKNLEDGLDASKLNESVSPQELQALKEQIRSHEAQTQRLKDYFKSSMQEFRNVIYMLLGYKVDRTSNSLYKLTSMYAESPEDQLCFQLNNDGNLNLLESRFSTALEDMVNLHLKHQKSIPVFLSAITMDLFNNKTIATKTYEID